MFKCNTRCCENYDLSIQQVQECITRCNGPSERADQYLQTEMQNFQVGFGYLTVFLYVEIHLYSANYMLFSDLYLGLWICSHLYLVGFICSKRSNFYSTYCLRCVFMPAGNSGEASEKIGLKN